jgi:hypothetical protein
MSQLLGVKAPVPFRFIEKTIDAVTIIRKKRELLLCPPSLAGCFDFVR